MSLDQRTQSTISKYTLILKLCCDGRAPLEMLAEGVKGNLALWENSPEAAPWPHGKERHTQQRRTLQPAAECPVDFHTSMPLFRSPKTLFLLHWSPVEVVLIPQRPI